MVKHDDLVIDIGFHRGEDTRFYLDKGFRCVAVEANPALVEKAECEFADEIADGRLRVFGVGPTLMRAQAIRVHHNLCGYGGAWTQNPLTRPYAWLANLAWHARHPTSRFSYRGWWDLHARLG